MIGDDIPAPVLYLRRYEYTHHSTGMPIKNGPWVTWHVVKNPKPGDYRYERGEKVKDGDL